MPTTPQEWTAIAAKFNEMWNYPNCIGAVDGKHVVMVAPANSGSIFFNYKGTHSIVLMAVADAEYKFTYIDVGCNGRISDGGVFNKCTFAAAMDENQLHFPNPSPLPGRTKPVPFVLVADDAFAMKPNIMKPYPGQQLNASQRVFNYRLSRARRVVENAFGILSSRFRVLRRPIHLDAMKTKSVTLACCALHNYLMTKATATYAPNPLVDRYGSDGTLIPGEWRNEPMRESCELMEEIATKYVPESAKQIREEFENYFMSNIGELPWQFQKI